MSWWTRLLAYTRGRVMTDQYQYVVTERARKLRAQYNLQAQGLRTRVEIRVNRIPMALRKAKMGDLVAKYTGGGSSTTQHASSRHAAAASQRPPPVPEKDVPPKRPMSQASTTAGNVSRGPGRPPKRLRCVLFSQLSYLFSPANKMVNIATKWPASTRKTSMPTARKSASGPHQPPTFLTTHPKCSLPHRQTLASCRASAYRQDHPQQNNNHPARRRQQNLL